MNAAHKSPERHVGDLARVVFPLEGGSWHGFATETLWAEVVSPGRYRLRNVPFYATGVSIDDIVQAQFAGAELPYERVVERAGHSTYRLFVKEGISAPSFRLYWSSLESKGCSFEQGGRLLAVDVPPETDIYAVYSILENGAEAEVWDFEEGHCGHPLRRGP